MTTRVPYPRTRRGVTLLELIVVVVGLGVMASVATLAMPKKLIPPDDTPHRVADARTRALRTGRPVSVVLRLDSMYAIATAMPDGTVLAAPAARIDRLTGQPLPAENAAAKAGSP